MKDTNSGRVMIVQVLDLLTRNDVPSTVSIYDLCVKCWRYKQAVFGLAGYSKFHPNFHTFRCYFYGRRGFIGEGLMTFDLEGRVALTSKGRVKASGLPRLIWVNNAIQEASGEGIPGSSKPGVEPE